MKTNLNLFAPAPEPTTPLGRYRILSPNAGIRVSSLTLGAMSIGEAWAGGMGAMDKDQSFALMDAYVAAGGNFIDTANNYQNEESEQWIGEWMAARGNRDRLVLATKYTTDYRSYQLGKGNAVNFCGNHKRSLHMSVRDSLAKLQTDWIDILYLHWWDYTTSIEEVMDALHILVQQGKVLYLGISDSPAWVVSAANTYARAHGKTPFSIYQGRWNVMRRDFERDIIPMARHFGLALAPWDVMGQGKFQTPQAVQERNQSGEGLRNMKGPHQTAEEVAISEALCKVAAEHADADSGQVPGPTAVALAYVMAKTPFVFPIIGGRKIDHLHANIQSLRICLTKEQIEYLESVQPFDVGFPTDFIGPDPKETGRFVGLTASSAVIDPVQSSKPIQRAG